MNSVDFDRLLDTIQTLVLHHSPSGAETEIDRFLGHVARAACLSFPTQNTHGYEIAHLGAIANCVTILKAFCERFK
jgi:putative aminopeptidase FrvX